MAEEKVEVFRINAQQEIAIAEGGEGEGEGKKPAEGPTELQQITDYQVTGTEGEREFVEVDIEKHAVEALGEINIAKQADDTKAPIVTPVAAPPVASVLIEKDDAIPWVLSIQLVERIKRLGSKTASVNQELDMLEAESLKLAKRIGK